VRRAVVLSALAAVALVPAAEASAPAATIPSFTFAYPSAPTNLDWANGSVPSGIAALVTEPIERYAYSGAVTPNLATSVSSLPGNHTMLVYTIRKGVRFSDGRPLEAQDVAWSLTHLTSPTSRQASILHGAVVTVVGPRKVKVQLPFYLPTMRQSFARYGLIEESSFAEAHQTDLGTAGAMPVGTGPYMYSSYDGNGITLTRNPYYWGPKPPIEKLFFPPITNDSSAELALRAGSIQAASLINTSRSSDWAAIPGVRLYQSLGVGTVLIAFNTVKPPFDDLHVRKAVAYSLDREGLVNAAFGGSWARLLKVLVPIGELEQLAPSTAAATQFLDGLPQYGFDLAKAKAELAQSAYPNGFSTTVDYIPGGGAEIAVLNLRQNLAGLGVTLTTQPVTNAQFAAELVARSYTIVDSGFGLSPADPISFVGGLTSSDFTNPANQDYAGWTSPEIARARAEMLYSTGRAARWKAITTILADVARQVPYDPLLTYNRVYALAPGYTFATHQLTDFDFFNGSWVWLVHKTSS
jgi:peptide/nickel transport system substrate-binding protein